MGKGIKSVCRSQTENMFQLMAMCEPPKELSLHQALNVISMKSIKIIRQEVFANEEAILVFLAGSKLNGKMGKNGKGGLTGRGKRRINTKTD